ncbi:DUF87 domain-containing protein, partial [bacterium]|nr:DUF87 domain-containing protein [bacterium]
MGHEVAQGESALVLDREDLVTHAVVLGRTGSGKTGLMHVLLEEAVLQGASAMVLDPKGDLTNLLLAFPGLDPRDLMRWVPAGKTAPEEALRIKEGLERSGQSVERISQWKKAASFHVYSPGKLRGGGSGVDVLPSFGAPPREASLSSPAKRERASAIVSAILHALSVEADPLSDP